ncbi:MAG: type II toxin-antitoxin system VapC family toxin, partial [Geminicoccaceae bacterium]
MRFLLDTNVISEWTKPRPDPAIVDWLEAADEDTLYLSVLAFAEIRLGIELLPEGRKRARISAWLDGDLAARFEGRIIGIEREIAEAWAQIVARGRAHGATPPILDAFLAATALVHQMTLVTRNERDLVALDV